MPSLYMLPIIVAFKKLSYVNVAFNYIKWNAFVSEREIWNIKKNMRTHITVQLKADNLDKAVIIIWARTFYW